MSRNRSVNDFDTKEGLKAALKSQNCRAVFSDVHRVNIGINGSIIDDDASSIASSVSEQQELDWVLTNYNAQLSQTQSLSEELKRLQCLKSYLLLDSEREPSFERLTALASRMFRVPIALVSLVDLGRQWFMSNRGLGDVRETPRKLAFCAHAILSKEDLFVVTDASKDLRFCENPLVSGPPHIRFYAGAPLKCPEGYTLGTFCIIDSKPRQSGLSLEEKQNLRELAALAMDAMVDRKREQLRIQQNKSQMIACTAHDLLTPLNGVQMSLSLLMEDEELQLSENQKELLITAGSCTNVMNRICRHAIETHRGKSEESVVSVPRTSDGHIVLAELVQNLQMVMEPYPKSVPLYITLEGNVPPIVESNDLKIFRSAVNLLTNACKVTQRGSVHLKIFVSQQNQLVFECHDTGPGVPLEHYPCLFRPFTECAVDQETNNNCCSMDTITTTHAAATHMNNSGLGLYSVANQISSMGGEYGFRPQSDGAVFWFSVPLHVPLGLTSSRNRASYKDLPEVAQAQTVQLTRQVESLALKIQNLSASLSSSVNPDSKLCGDDKEVPDNTVVKPTRTSGNGVNEPMDTTNTGTEPSSKMDDEEPMDTTINDTFTESTKTTKKRIRRALVIDDSIVIRKSLGRALSKLGFEVKTSMNGLDGLKDLQTDIYDVVFCDFLMPVMDGLDCVQQYRDWEAIHRPWIHVYIIGISAHASANDMEKGLAAGMDDFKAKPVTLQMLKELDTSTELKRVSVVLDTVLDPIKHGVEPSNADNAETQHIDKRVKNNDGPVCLVGEDALNVSKSMSSIMEGKHWNPVMVNGGEDALRLLKMRNWDAVFLDESMPRLDGIRVIERFREWEKEHRVARQRNVFLISESFVPNPINGSVLAAYPGGFDGALGKPILPADLVKLLDKATLTVATSSDSCDIVTR